VVCRSLQWWSVDCGGAANSSLAYLAVELNGKSPTSHSPVSSLICIFRVNNVDLHASFGIAYFSLFIFIYFFFLFKLEEEGEVRLLTNCGWLSSYTSSSIFKLYLINLLFTQYLRCGKRVCGGRGRGGGRGGGCRCI
jgi:hypothetical protein